MTMALERRIAFAVFAVGVLIAIVALAACGGDTEEPPPDLSISPCPSAHSTLPVVATEISEDRGSIRVVGPGAACGFAAAQHERTVYVELRKRSAEPTDYEDLKCYDLALKQPLPANVDASPISPGRGKEADEGEVSALLASNEACAEPPEQEPSFIID